MHLSNYSKNEFLNLYRITSWELGDIYLTLSTSEKKDYLLAVDLKNVAQDAGGDEIIHLFVGESRIPAHLRPGLNFIYIPASFIDVPQTTVKLVSSVPLPENIFLDLVPADSGYLLDVGNIDAIPIIDYLFLKKGFHKSLSDNFRILKGKGEIKFPLYSIKGFRPVLKLKVKNETPTSSPLNLRLELNDSFLANLKLEAKSEWKVVECPLPESEGGETTSLLGIILNPEEKTIGIESAISFDWIRVEQVPISRPGITDL
ncbi:MAG: hypothetical protein U9N73_08655 [Candidatus Auribacterota bacterium]|nr:hypothetical protein [Candidatus Auribacterota bacterium]